MRRYKWALFAVIFGVILTFWLINRQSVKNPSIYQELAKAQGFKEEEWRGRPFLLHFWAKWCEPCAEEIPHLIEFASHTEISKRLKVMAVSLDESLDDSKSILPNHGQGLPEAFVLLHDPNQFVAAALGSYQYPETYLVDSEGRIQEKWVGPQKWKSPDVIGFFTSRFK